MLAADLIREASRAVAQRPARALLTALGSVFGVATLVAIIGLSQTASNQVSLRFDEVLSTRVTVEPASVEDPLGLAEADLDTIRDVVGVTGVARMTVLSGRIASTRSSFGRQAAITPVAASDGFEDVLDVEFIAGTPWDGTAVVSTGASVAVVGETVMLEMDAAPFDGPFAIWVDGAPVTVVGVVRGKGRDAVASGWVIVPETTAPSDLWGRSASPSLLVRVERGAGPAVADVLPFVIDPEAPSRYAALAPPAPEILRGNIEADTRLAFIVAGAIALVAGTVAISVATLTSVTERTEQFGLRRTLGARRGDIARLVLIETMSLGIGGGLAGCLVGLAIVMVASVSSGWMPVFDSRLIPMAIAIGTVVGGIAGLGPAIKASTVEPIRALRRV